MDPCWCDVCTIVTRCTLDGGLQGCQVHPKRGRCSWPVGNSCHNSASENTSSTHIALAAAVSSTKAASLIDSSSVIALSLSHACSFSLSSRSLFSSIVHPLAARTIGRRITRMKPDDLLRTHTGDFHFLSHNKDCDNAW